MKRRDSIFRRGIPFVWGSASMAIFALAMLGVMLYLVLVNGLGHFWPASLYEIQIRDGGRYIGAVAGSETLRTASGEHSSIERRTNYKIGARDVYGLDYKWIDDSAVSGRTAPADIVAIEREQYGDVYGRLSSVIFDSVALNLTGSSLYDSSMSLISIARDDAEMAHNLEREISRQFAPLNEAERLLAAAHTPERIMRLGGQRLADSLTDEVVSMREVVRRTTAPLHDSIAAIQNRNGARFTSIVLVSGQTISVPLADVARVWRPNNMNALEKLGHYLVGLWTFVSANPREANTSGGIWPAIYGTILMVFLMVLGVAPLGVMAALYLHEYAHDNWFVRLVRLAVNNLAGVPSIVFGVFGLGFFIYFVGAGVDRAFFGDFLPSPTFGTGGILWASLTLALLTVPVVIVATEEGLAAVPRDLRHGSLALGATKFQTIRKIVLPYSAPGILTGLILAVARGAGEVAPLMLTGVAPLVSEAPLDGSFPFLHLDRKFMHLGFHIYDVGFQSPNVEAVKPLVYSTTLVLILLVVALNLTAIIVRNRLRKKFRGSVV